MGKFTAGLNYQHPSWDNYSSFMARALNVFHICMRKLKSCLSGLEILMEFAFPASCRLLDPSDQKELAVLLTCSQRVLAILAKLNHRILELEGMLNEPTPSLTSGKKLKPRDTWQFAQSNRLDEKARARICPRAPYFPQPTEIPWPVPSASPLQSPQRSCSIVSIVHTPNHWEKH